DFPERDVGDVAPDHAHFAGVDDRVRLLEDVLEQAELVEQVGGARLQHFTSELALERVVPLEHDHAGAPLGEQQAEHHPGRAAADDRRIHVHTRHSCSSPATLRCRSAAFSTSSLASIRASRSSTCPTRPWSKKKLETVAVNTPINAMPSSIRPTAMNRPSGVTGDTTP